uniref:SOXP-1 n=1 Tax=Schmidtea mediterranea TaxID=79327 RepID=H9CXU8_SCHMD|nr:SOXP-1 [Schmidtea mediterranea]AFJ24741.1 soxP-4 [Schmidtea mediterranea]
MLCSNCSNNQDTLKLWMVHLASCHPLPPEWLSEKAKVLNDDENQRPYTIVTDSRKRRRRPTTPRPLNTFMIFSRHIRRNILSVFPDASNSQLSKELGILWKKVTNEIKSLYEEEAKRLAQLHALEFPDYKYQPKKRVRRFGRAIYDRQPCTTERSNSTSATDEENGKDNNSVQDGRRSSDIENQYIRYSVLGKNIVKRECQSFNSPLKSDNVKLETQEQDFIQAMPKPLNVRITNYNENSIFLRQQRLPSSSTMYLLPSENLIISNGIMGSQDLENVNIDDEIDITGNIFSNDLDLEWSEIDENYKQDLPNLNSLFQH